MAEFKPTPEQTSILNAEKSSTMLIVAGAGSGKTFTMTARIIELIKNGVEPQKILGLTFTKAAANELLTRVAAAVNGNRARMRTRGHEEDADSSYYMSDDHADMAFMKPEVYTYDAFFQSIVRQYGLLVGMDPNTVPLSTAGAYQLADEVIRDHMRDVVNAMGEQESSDLDDMGSYTTFVRNVVTLSEAISSCMIDKTCTSVDEAIARIEKWDSAFITHLDKIVDHEFAELKNLPDFGVKIKMTTSKTVKGFDKWMNEKGKDYLAGILVEIRENTRLRSVYLTYVKLLAQRKREQHMAQFSDFTIAAMQLVQRFPWIGEQYRSCFSHVFLDEYQDSSTAQASLIAEIFAPHGASLHLEVPTSYEVSSRHEISLRSSALTAVGDPYQAIYAWRGAAPGAFVSFLHHVGVSKPLSLSVSMRNPRIVLDVANKLTQPLREGHRDAYGRKGTITLHEVRVPKLSARDDASQGSIAALAYASRKQEIDGVVRYAKKAVEKSKKHNDELIKQGEAAKSGPFVAVLLRSKTHMGEFAQAFNEAGLSVQVDGVQSVLDRPDAHDIINLLAAVADHSQTAAALSVLASTRFDIPAADLREFADAVSMYNVQLQRELLDSVGVGKPDRGSWSVPPVTSLVDVLIAPRKIRDSIVKQYYHGSDLSVRRIEDFARALTMVNSVSSQGLETVIRAAGDALGVDIDVAVAYAITREKGLTGEALPVSSVDSLVELSQTYAQELSESQRPTLSGFLSWVQSADSNASDDPTIVGSAQADVTICTIHHSKGLEWDSVIIPEMNEATFPSNQGSNLSFDAVYDDEPMPSGQYVAYASTWLTDPTAVPAPVRADADAVPRFADENQFDELLPDALSLEARVHGQLHLPQRDALSTTMSLREESGQSVLEEERRLAYVTVTRAKRDVLMTGAVKATSLMDNFSPVGYTSAHDQDQSLTVLPQFDKCSIFLAEVQEYLHSGEVAEEYGHDNVIDIDEQFEDSEFIDKPIGIFVGHDAFEYAAATVGGALDAARDAVQVDNAVHYEHPRRIDSRIGDVLDASARVLSTDNWEPNNSDDFDESEKLGELRHAAQRVYEAMSTLGYTHSDSSSVTMTVDSAAVHATTNPRADGTNSVHTVSDEEQKLIEAAQQVMRQRNASVTTIQREAANASSTSHTSRADHTSQLQRARAIMRPVPNIVNYDAGGQLSVAHMGTAFHAFAQRYFKPDNAAVLDSQEFRQSKEMIRSEVENETTHGEYEERMHAWKVRLLSSQFDPSECDGTEVPFAYVPEDTDRTVVGVIDAVFEGQQLKDSPISRHAHDEGREILYTVIDWKTGHKPQDEAEKREKLLQVDMYREILATLKGVDVDQVDAALYYVSENKEEDRLIPAAYKTQEQIEDILRGVSKSEGKLENRDD
ncbi:UvrD-helicase domain-containing protein [Alloscardovia venturai]|uniref:DNA 3'-5' helicase n=1 Tax=Alloscardovia venturai TaxID=1769421 RepID=A0ABW2Y5Y9_9BIFI